MLALAGGHRACFLFKQIFLEQMPDDIRLMLADEDFDDLRRLASAAQRRPPFQPRRQVDEIATPR
jgi:hypothetical protein